MSRGGWLGSNYKTKWEVSTSLSFLKNREIMGLNDIGTV